MNSLFYDLPEYLQDKIIRMNPHPIAELFKEAMHYEKTSYIHTCCFLMVYGMKYLEVITVM